MSETAPHENPLVPNKKLLQIYTVMAQARILNEHIAKAQRKAKRQRLGTGFREEACRVATAIELRQGDLVSDAQMCATMDLLFGATLTPLLRHIAAVISGSQAENTISTETSIATRQLPWIDSVEHRLNMALGAALALRSQKQNNIVMAYAYYAELPKRSWKQLLALTAKLNLPIIFVILPDADGKSGNINLCAKARATGIPGIPVDASDAIALYRVAQESIGRSRGGDGPVLIECTSSQLAEQRSSEISDPILYMKQFLIGRNISTEKWVNHVGDSFRKKLAKKL